ncbi:9328_t:CDS:2, partial [Funneliformis mosseae]
ILTTVISYRATPSRDLGNDPSKITLNLNCDSEFFYSVQASSFKIGNYTGRAGQGSARSDFASIIVNNNDLQFAFFIVEFEQAGFEIHKDEMHYPTEMEVNETRLHFGLVNDTKVRLGSLQPIYNQEKFSLVCAYEDEIISFNFQENNVEAKLENVLHLITRPVQINNSLKLTLPELPKEAVQS